jgi:hypothetical protein
LTDGGGSGSPWLAPHDGAAWPIADDGGRPDRWSRGAVTWVGERRDASGDLVEVSSGADLAGDVPSAVRCLPRRLEEGGDGEVAN